MARWKIHLKKKHLLWCNFLIQQPIHWCRIFIPCKTHRLDKDQVAMAGGSLTSMWDIRELLSAFPDLEEVSLVKIDAAAWLIPEMECPKDDDFFRCLARHWPNTVFLMFFGRNMRFRTWISGYFWGVWWCSSYCSAYLGNWTAGKDSDFRELRCGHSIPSHQLSESLPLFINTLRSCWEL